MGDVIPFFMLAVIAVAVWVVFAVAKTSHHNQLARRLPQAALENPANIHKWFELLHDFDEVTQQQLNDLDIRPLLPKEMQDTLRQLHREFRSTI